MGSPAFFTNHLLPQTEAWVAQTEILKTTYSTPLPSGQYVGYVNALIAELIIGGSWYHLDRMWLFAAEQQKHAWLSIVNPNGLNATWPSYILEQTSPSWTADVGYSSNGSDYLNTQFNLSSGAKYSLTDASFGFYQSVASPSDFECGVFNNIGMTGAFTYINIVGTVYNGGINSAAPIGQTDSGTKQTMFSLTRVSTNSGFINFYKGGTMFSSKASTVASGLQNADMYVLANNDIYNSAVDIAPTPITLACFWLGGGSVNIANISSAFSTFLAAI